ncbi:MAG TPA: hypothetical protein VHP83_21390 [Aggregatilineaceae bacterium]|nr:hypothetical protein [Aggregatilineaceae bacterium]
MKVKITGKEKPGQAAGHNASTRVQELRALIVNPPADLETVISGLSAADQKKLLVALALEVSLRL